MLEETRDDEGPPQKKQRRASDGPQTIVECTGVGDEQKHEGRLSQEDTPQPKKHTDSDGTQTVAVGLQQPSASPPAPAPLTPGGNTVLPRVLCDGDQFLLRPPEFTVAPAIDASVPVLQSDAPVNELGGLPAPDPGATDAQPGVADDPRVGFPPSMVETADITTPIKQIASDASTPTSSRSSSVSGGSLGTPVSRTSEPSTSPSTSMSSSKSDSVSSPPSSLRSDPPWTECAPCSIHPIADIVLNPMQVPPIKANGQYKGYNNEDGDEATGDTCQTTKQKPLNKRPAGQIKNQPARQQNKIPEY